MLLSKQEGPGGKKKWKTGKDREAETRRQTSYNQQRKETRCVAALVFAGCPVLSLNPTQVPLEAHNPCPIINPLQPKPASVFLNQIIQGMSVP